MIHVKVTMLPTEFSVDQDSLDPILIDNGSVQCVIQVSRGFYIFCFVFCIYLVNDSVQCAVFQEAIFCILFVKPFPFILS